MSRFRLRREPFRFSCPGCGGIFVTIHVSMERRRNRLPALRSMRGDITCDQCGLVTDADDWVREHRGWPEPARRRTS